MQEIKPTWKLAWGIMWRMVVIYLAIWFPFWMLKVVFHWFSVSFLGVDF